ncbi:MAG: hypothetical protein HOP29_04120 [Phycisphaerales bacterium]|nr:hypothetical protein [Phycisphaerales bacterium]
MPIVLVVPITADSHVPPSAESVSRGRPFCFACGYDLSGLTLPRPCPECGRLRQPGIDETDVRSWFATRVAAWQFFVRPRKAPAGLLYCLSDDASTRIARRREWRWLYLPALLSFLSVALGCFVTVDYVTTTRFYERTDPSRKVLRVQTNKETDHVFDHNLHLFRHGFFVGPPATWKWDVERERLTMGLGVPEFFSPFTFFCGCMPILVTLLGYLPTKRTAQVAARRPAWQPELPDFRRSVRTAWTLTAVPLGLASWAWFGAVWILAAAQTAIVPIPEEIVLPWFVMSAIVVTVGWWAMASAIGPIRVVCSDRGRALFYHRTAAIVSLAIMGIGTPLTFVWLIGYLIW